MPKTSYPTGLTKLDARGRITIPQPVLKGAGWDALADKESLFAEIVGAEHLRLHREGTIAARVREELDEIESNSEVSDEERLIRFQVHSDRYRKVQLIKKDNNRIVLPVDLAAIFDSTLSPSIKLFVQAGDDFLDVMANTVRLARLLQY